MKNGAPKIETFPAATHQSVLLLFGCTTNHAENQKSSLRLATEAVHLFIGKRLMVFESIKLDKKQERLKMNHPTYPPHGTDE